LTRETLYQFVFQYRPAIAGPTRDLFVAALEAEGIPCDGRFYEPVYRSDLFCATPENCPQLVVGREQPMDYSQCSCMLHSLFPHQRPSAQISGYAPRFFSVRSGIVRAIPGKPLDESQRSRVESLTSGWHSTFDPRLSTLLALPSLNT
jgi:hypothetical protein